MGTFKRAQCLAPRAEDSIPMGLQVGTYYLVWGLPRGSNVVPFWVVYYIVPKKKIGHNQKGTTLEPLGPVYV